ncbi:hypothetical protein ACGFNY_19810 [Streptomyces chartreusis]|uniref:hypothetical protein n=1 Tax=Streptomyces chartreusis TaxID=1969 RepID=UPI00371F6AF0
MADEQYRWLDRETAERLLRGESLEAVDAADRDQAERLAKTLEALTAEPPLTSAELPGEGAALAAFRAAREGRDDTSATVGDGPGRAASEAADVGLVRLGRPARAARRPRWARPVRLGLAAALAVGMVGGIGVAAGTGVLPTPFDRNEPARPAATVSAPVPTENPLISPSPRTGEEEPTPDGGSEPPSASGAPEDTVEPGGPPAGDHDSASQDGKNKHDGWWKAVTSYCRDVRDGRPLPVDRRRTLEGAAGSAARVRKYCESVLAGAGESTRSQRDGDENEGDDKGHGRGDDDQDKDRGKGHGKGGGNGKGNGHGRGRGDDEDRSLGHRDDRLTDSASHAASTVTRAYAAPLPAVSL